MAKLNSGTISGRTVDALPVGDRETVFWDRDMAGFGGARLSLGREGLSRSGTGWRKDETCHDWPAWAGVGRGRARWRQRSSSRESRGARSRPAAGQ